MQTWVVGAYCLRVRARLGLRTHRLGFRVARGLGFRAFLAL